MTNYQEYLLSRVEDLFEDSEISEKASYELRQAIRHGDPEPKFAGPGKGDTVISPDEEPMKIKPIKVRKFVQVVSATGRPNADAKLSEMLKILQDDGNTIEYTNFMPDPHHNNMYLGVINYSFKTE